jgi:HSP20 family molecular chaperone IbpA
MSSTAILTSNPQTTRGTNSPFSGMPANWCNPRNLQTADPQWISSITGVPDIHHYLQSTDVVTSNSTFQPVTPAYEPATLVNDEATETVIQVELCGVSEKCMNILLRGDTITICGTKEQTMPVTNTGNVCCAGPAWCGRFCRTVCLGYCPEQKQVSATLCQGVLTVCVKKPQGQKSESIRITPTSN